MNYVGLLDRFNVSSMCSVSGCRSAGQILCKLYV